MPTAGSKTDKVLASARKELQAQLDAVREEQARLVREESALTQALSSLNGGGSSATTEASGGNRPPRSRAAESRGSTRSGSSGQRRRRRGASKPTAERVEELRGLLADGPKSRGDLAALLNVSPARVQQLLTALGSSVSSEADPERGRGKLWTLKGSGNGSGAEPAAKRAGRAQRGSAAKKQ